MSSFLSPIEVSSALPREAFLSQLEARCSDWRESHAGANAQRVGILRWRLRVSGNRVVIIPTWSAHQIVLRASYYRPVLVGQLVETNSGSVLRGQLGAMDWLTGIILPRAIIWASVVLGFALFVGAFLNDDLHLSWTFMMFALVVVVLTAFVSTVGVRDAFVEFVEGASGESSPAESIA